MLRLLTIAGLMLVTLLMSGCGDDGDDASSDSKRQDTKASSSKAPTGEAAADDTAETGSSSADTDLLARIKAGFDEPSQTYADGTEQEDFEKTEQGLAEMFDADSAIVTIADGAAGDLLRCAQPDEGTAAFMFADDWEGGGDTLIGLRTDTEVVAFSEKAGEDEGFVRASCDNGVAGDLESIE